MRCRVVSYLRFIYLNRKVKMDKFAEIAACSVVLSRLTEAKILEWTEKRQNNGLDANLSNPDEDQLPSEVQKIIQPNGNESGVR